MLVADIKQCHDWKGIKCAKLQSIHRTNSFLQAADNRIQKFKLSSGIY